MSWILPKRQRVNTAGDRGGRPGNSQDDAAAAVPPVPGGVSGLLEAVAKLSLNTAQRNRELEGVVISGWMMDIASPAVTAMKDAGVTYSEALKDRKENPTKPDPGSPHLQSWAALAAVLAEVAVREDGPPELQLSSKLMKEYYQWMTTATADEVGFAIRSCRVKINQQSKGKGKGEGEAADKDGARILLGLVGEVGAGLERRRLEQVVNKLMFEVGASRRFVGSPPPTHNEREVQRLLRQANARRR
jgi:hypothetical protein